VKAIKDHKLMFERQTVINGLRVVGTLFCMLCNIVLLLIASSHFVNNKEITYKRNANTIVAESNKTTTYADKDAVVINKEFKVPSQTVKAINNKTGRLIKEEEIIYDSDNDNGTDVKLLTTKQQTGRDKLLDIHPKASAPP
jgi:hypothetical protein